MVRVLAFGTFDVIHPGHINYLEQAKSLGNELWVIIATDKNVEKIKGKKPTFSQEERKKIIESLRVVDKAIIGFEEDLLKSVEKTKPDIIALGYDQKPNENELYQELEKRQIKAKIVRLKPYNQENHKSTAIKEKIKKS